MKVIVACIVMVPMSHRLVRMGLDKIRTIFTMSSLSVKQLIMRTSANSCAGYYIVNAGLRRRDLLWNVVGQMVCVCVCISGFVED